MGNLFANIFANKELKDRIVYTFMMFIVFRLGVHIPVPGVDASVIENIFQSGNLFGFLDLFSGGALSKFSIFAMSITPFINAQIIMQMLVAVIPSLEELRKDGQEGFKKIQKMTRYFTIFLAFVQAFGISYGLRANGALVDNSWFFLFFVCVVLTAGTCLLMWIGEKITEHGIGNGISLIIFCGIVARFPEALQTIVQYLEVGTITPLQALLFAAIALAMIVVVIEVNEGQRRIPVQYAKRVIGRKMYGGHSTFLPLKVNQAGVIPIIFASSILMLPVTLAQFVHVGWVQALAKFFGWGTWANTCLYAILIVIFTYFYTAITVNVTELADNMKKYGGFIPGIRPGEPTMRYVDKVLTRITLTGSVFLAFIAILPNFIGSITNIQGVYFGGTALLIIVGVALDTMRQAQSLMVTRNYQGFIK
ncbi:preprotein translocase subunit SecY [Allisonella histaminiformans]|jgi:preprotein translocase subunit SecY|uniref:preprotein translocase subunit SecY n=1 Tax=Allisonella histaminiformans TaxID=209880 RepID=UPI002591CB15|nr:preprotein translocase subunit SecY [Allisonella histaminiformans]